MTEFKLEVGKRYVIVGSEGGHKFPLGAEVRVLDKSNLATTSPDNDPPFKLGVTAYICPSDVRPVDNEPQPGDRVRVSYEGVVTAIEKGLIITIKKDSGDSIARALRLADVEILERAPKPYPRGTVVKAKHSQARPLIRDVTHDWRNYAGDAVTGVTDDRVRAGEFEVIYEPSQSA